MLVPEQQVQTATLTLAGPTQQDAPSQFLRDLSGRDGICQHYTDFADYWIGATDVLSWALSSAKTFF